MLIFRWPFGASTPSLGVRLGHLIDSGGPRYLLDEGCVVGPFWVLPRKAEYRLHAAVSCFSRPVCGSGGP